MSPDPTTPVSKTGFVIDGYVGLATWWLDAWSNHAKSVFTKVEQEGYAASDVMEMTTQASKLVYETMMRGTVEYYDAMAIYASNLGADDVEVSQPYVTTETTGERTFRAVQPWTAQGGQNTLPPETLFQFFPSKLFDGDDTFRFMVTIPDAVTAGCYDGTLEVLNASGEVVDTILDASIDV
jgi:hypothetical protein